MANIKDHIDNLEQLFDFFNNRLFESTLSKPVITIMQDTTSGAYGWCTSYPAWKDNDGQGYYEINICADYLSRPVEQTAQTLLHEMIHLYNLGQGIKDTSRSGCYHNSRFKESAEAHGLIVEKGAKYGFHKTSFKPETLEMFKENSTVAFDLCRVAPSKSESKKKTSTRKYVCPDCGLSIRATKEVFIICGECEKPMQLEEQ